ncbi:hypothetical protein FRC02_008221 [Tulasnella sp. 418]|nr:hypothetical protein FRC02_008221 [Tulasnella sp. 418]
MSNQKRLGQRDEYSWHESQANLERIAAELEAIITERYLRQPGDWIGAPPYHLHSSLEEETEKKMKIESPVSSRHGYQSRNYSEHTRIKLSEETKTEEEKPDSKHFVANLSCKPEFGGMAYVKEEVDVKDPYLFKPSKKERTVSPEKVLQSSRVAPRQIFVKEEELEELMVASEQQAYVGISGPKLEKWPDVKVKVKKEAAELSEESVQRRLDAAGARRLDISAVDAQLLHRSFRRAKLTKILGGNPMTIFSRANELFCRIHQTPLIFYPELGWNPHAPRIPGAPGVLLIGIGKEIERESGPLFVKLGTEALWTYMGHYEYMPSEPLTKEEFAALSEEAKQTICDDHACRSWAKPFIAQLHFQKKYGRLGNRNELEEVIKQMRGIAGKWRYLNQVIDVDDVRQAFANGQRRLSSAVVNCIRYDLTFLEMIIERYVMTDDQIQTLYNRIIAASSGRNLLAPRQQGEAEDIVSESTTPRRASVRQTRQIKERKRLGTSLRRNDDSSDYDDDENSLESEFGD